MPQIDLPIEKLREYQGRNPRPADFDAFWDKSLEELRGIAPDVELVDADFQSPAAHCQHLYFTGTGGARIHARLLTPRNLAGKRPAICAYHGYTGSSEDWFRYHAWVGCGFIVAALDCRGQGGRSEDIIPTRGGTLYGHIVKGVDDVPERLYYRNVFLDTARLVQIVQQLEGVDPTRVSTYGGSQGGGLSLAAAALEPSVYRTVSIYPFLCDYKRVWEMDLAKNAYVGLSDYFKKFDPRHEREDAVFTKLGYVDVQYLAPRIKAEVLMATGLMDEVCPPSTQFAAYNKIQSKKNVLIYPDLGHVELSGFADKAAAFLFA